MSDEAFANLARIVTGLAIIIAAWALLADWVRQRFRRRRRCPRCWYDMSRSPTLTCSECGYTAKKERRLFKARRRWRYVWLALLMLLAGHALRIAPEVRHRGWVAAVPTTVLILALPWLEAPSVSEGRLYFNTERLPFSRTALCFELLDRYTRGSAPSWQSDWIMRRSVRLTTWDGFGDGSDADAAGWVLSHAIYLKGGLPQDVLPALLDPIASDVVCMRERWPRATPLRIAIRDSRWHWISSPRRLVVEPVKPPGRRLERLLFDQGIPPPTWRDSTHDLGLADLAAEILEFDVALIEEADSEDVVLWSKRITKSIELVDEIEQIIRPAPSSVVRSSMEKGTRIRVYRDYPGARKYSVILDLTALDLSRPDDIAIGLRAEILHGDQVMVQVCVWRGREWSTDFRKPIFMQGDAERVYSADLDDPLWILRIRGDAEVALRDFEHDSYWNGDVTLPLSEVDFTRE
jgi:hypothetical protein